MMERPAWMPKIGYEWTQTPSGNEFWGPLGAAGILFHHPESDTYLLGHRSPEVHHGDTWGIPGGAIDPGEEPYEAALREAREEFGEVPQHTVVNEHVASPDPDWNYHTFTAEVPQQFDPEYANDWETQGHGWFTPQEIGQLPLHPGFASTWNSGALRKEAKNGYFFHTAPREHREEIEKSGLLPTDEAPVSPWENMYTEQRDQQPQGVYMWDDPVNARGYAYNLQGRVGGEHFPGDEGGEQAIYESPEYYDHMDNYPGDYDENMDPTDPEAYDEYMGNFKRQPLYDIWKVNTLGLPEVYTDPEMAIHHGELSAEDAQQRINDQGQGISQDVAQGIKVHDPEGRHKYVKPYDPDMVDKTEGHRWYVPHAIEPARLTLHDSIQPEDMTMDDWEQTNAVGKQVPDAWHQVPLQEWNEKAQQRYLGDPNVMREQAPQDQSPMAWEGY